MYEDFSLVRVGDLTYIRHAGHGVAFAVRGLVGHVKVVSLIMRDEIHEPTVRVRGELGKIKVILHGA